MEAVHGSKDNASSSSCSLRGQGQYYQSDHKANTSVQPNTESECPELVTASERGRERVRFSVVSLKVVSVVTYQYGDTVTPYE